MKCYLCKATKNKDGTPVKHYKCKECATRKQKEYYAKNPEKFRKRKREFKKHNPDKQQEYDKRARRKLKIDSLKAYSKGKPHCINCKTEEIDFLCLDHIKNNGAECRKLRGGGNTFFFWLRKNKYPDIGLQVLCYNCNNYKKVNKRLP